MENRETRFLEINDFILEKFKWLEDKLPNCNFIPSGNRKHLTPNYERPASVPIGIVKKLNKTYAIPKFDKDYPDVYPVIKEIVDEIKTINNLDFKYNGGYMNKNVQMIPHKDKNNVDMSLIFCLGDYVGGELNIEGEKYDIKNKPLLFDGKVKEHWVEFFKGNRYSIIMYES